MNKTTLDLEDTIWSIEHYIAVRESGLTMERIQKKFFLSEANVWTFELGYQCYLKKILLDKAVGIICSYENTEVGHSQKDAQLRAATPNLLRACKIALEYYSEIDSPTDIQSGIIAILEAAVRKAESSTESSKKFLFRINDDGVAEWIVAETKLQAFEFADKFWGGLARGEYFKEYLEDNPGATIEEFIDYFVTLEDPEKQFTFHKDNGDRETKTIREWLENETEVPGYFGCSEY